MVEGTTPTHVPTERFLKRLKILNVFGKRRGNIQARWAEVVRNLFGRRKLSFGSYRTEKILMSAMQLT